MKDNVLYDQMTWPEAKERIPKARGILINLGSVEQHGYHMALATDNVLATEMAVRIAQKTDFLVLPVMPFGQVWSAKDFPGSISLSDDTLRRVLVEVALSVHRHGARSIVFHSGHMGNKIVMRDAARELYDKYSIKNVWFICYNDYVKLAEGILEAPMWNKTGMHASEFETSMLLAVRPDLVDLSKAVVEYPDAPPDLDCRNVPWFEYTKTGAPGDPTISTAEKGHALLDKLVEHMAAMINAMVP